MRTLQWQLDLWLLGAWCRLACSFYPAPLSNFKTCCRRCEEGSCLITRLSSAPRKILTASLHYGKRREKKLQASRHALFGSSSSRHVLAVDMSSPSSPQPTRMLACLPQPTLTLRSTLEQKCLVPLPGIFAEYLGRNKRSLQTTAKSWAQMSSHTVELRHVASQQGD